MVRTSTLQEALAESAVDEAVFDDDNQGLHIVVVGHCCAVHDFSMTVVRLAEPLMSPMHEVFGPGTSFHENEHSLIARLEELSVSTERGWSPVGEVTELGRVNKL